MPDPSESLWPSDIRPTIQSPFSVLRLQADALTAQTAGILKGDVAVRLDGEKHVITLDITAPILGTRSRVLTVTHQRLTAYPAIVDAEIFRPRGIIFPVVPPGSLSAILSGSPREKLPNEADSDEELRALVARVLKSSEVKTMAVSLIALANERLKRQQEEAENKTIGQSSEPAKTPEPPASPEAQQKPEAPANPEAQ